MHSEVERTKSADLELARYWCLYMIWCRASLNTSFNTYDIPEYSSVQYFLLGLIERKFTCVRVIIPE
jgi:hypothetical protein